MTTADDKRLQDQMNAADNAGAVVDFGDECTRCMDCQQPYAVWFADNDVWNLVMGGPGCKGDPGGMLCPRCFALRAETVYALPIWHLRLERVNRVLQADDTPPDTRLEVEAPAGHRYGVMDGRGGQWLVEVCDEYPDPSPIGLVDDILRDAALRDTAGEPRRAGICWTGDCLQPAMALTFNDWPVCHEHGGEQVRKVAEAVKDVCWRATQYGQTEDGDTFAYIVTKGAMHRLIAAAQGAGISASFRSGPQETLPDPARHDADIAAAKAAGAAEVIARVEAVLSEDKDDIDASVIARVLAREVRAVLIHPQSSDSGVAPVEVVPAASVSGSTSEDTTPPESDPFLDRDILGPSTGTVT